MTATNTRLLSDLRERPAAGQGIVGGQRRGGRRLVLGAGDHIAHVEAHVAHRADVVGQMVGASACDVTCERTCEIEREQAGSKACGERPPTRQLTRQLTRQASSKPRQAPHPRAQAADSSTLV